MKNLITAVLYEDDGRIVSTQQAPAGILVGQLLEVKEFRTDYDLTHYVRNGRLRLRPGNTAALAEGRLSNLPAPCVIVINGKRYDCVDRTAELDFTYPGVYSITVEAFPHLNAEFTVTVP